VVLASPRGYAARVKRLREQKEAVAAAWIRMKAQRRRPAQRGISPPSQGIPPDVA